MLRVEGLRRRVGSFELSIDDWCVETGAYVVLVGPSGAGKTMLLESLCGLHEVDAGRVLIHGADVTRAAPEARRIGYVYQDCWLFPHLTVRQNIDFGRRYHRAASANVPTTDVLAEMLHVTRLLDRRPTTLSGGERQRVALARALAVQPALLFLDEPLGTLDPVTREHVAAELLNCHRAIGTTTIHVTHDHAEARMLGDLTAVILNGRLEQAGATDQVFGRPKTIALARFLGCENVFETVATRGAADGRMRVGIGGETFSVPSASPGRVALCVRPEDVQVDSPVPGAPGEASDGAIVLSGQVTAVSHRGPMVRLVVDVHGSSWVSLIGQSEQRSRRFQPEDDVIVRVPAEAVHVISLE